MSFALTDEQVELGRTAGQVFADAAQKVPLPPSWDAVPPGLDRELWSALGELGLLGLGVAEELGGSGGGVRELCVLAEQVGAALPAIPFASSAAVVATLAAQPEDSPARNVLDELAEGSRVATAAWETFPVVIDPGRGRGALRQRGPQVDGSLSAVPFGLDADLLVAFGDDRGAMLIDLSAPGARRASTTALDVTEPLASVELTGATAIPLAPCAFESRVRAAFAAELVGTGQRALDGAVEYAGQRRQFGRAIGSFQSIKHMLADRYVQLDAARMLVQLAAAAIDDGLADADSAARTALAAACDAAESATGDALQVHGGIGFTWEHPSHVYLKRARARRSLLGSSARQLDAIADHVLTPN
ncbi:acyl-CoA dehydrogenase family protein [Saccharopolyspora mangrovi]|uniref:Acyl-CoA dehydrogenase family protein n=1 Tax=Saccharopolyspora mangrovi TaxID=3082379 RepID=A0ABU6AC18_9PSEU|nr:acyl-CoA dehydrogenase family protein [Saccharopolyspora sp. S2-29]MEB3369003.1 acyl-CoA dehydrogenase family protein [Saccharopolyspora sp. S2-29]